VASLRRAELAALQVKAGRTGVLQSTAVQPGQQVTPGTVLARVADPTRLKAELRVPETQARDVAIGLPANVDTRNGVVAGRVVRVDPAVVNGTVLVDVALEGELPRGARPDLSVDGTIVIEQLDDVLTVGRPAFGQPDSRVTLFKLSPDGDTATRVAVQLGRGSVHRIEVIEGLQEGDRVILSDMSTWDAVDRVQLE
jgi:HlyD family secretion protein